MNWRLSAAIFILTAFYAAGQQYGQINFGLSVGSYNSFALGGNLEYGRISEKNWIKALSYQYFNSFGRAATDLFTAELNYQSLIASIGYEAKILRWTSFTFALGGGMTHAYDNEDNLIGPTLQARMEWLVHFGKRTSLILPLFILPRSAQLSWINYYDYNFFHRVEGLPIGIRVKL